MKKRTILSCILIAMMAILMLSGCSSQAQAPQAKTEEPQKTLTMAINATFPPFESIQVDDKCNKSFVGIDMDIASYIAEKLNVKLEINDMAFNGLVTAISSGRADLVVSGISPTA